MVERSVLTQCWALARPSPWKFRLGHRVYEFAMSRRILMIEDTEDNRQILRDLFAATDYDLIEATDGAAGVAIAIAEKPDLILMDIQLPVLDGYEATRRIKAEPTL